MYSSKRRKSSEAAVHESNTYHQNTSKALPAVNSFFFLAFPVIFFFLNLFGKKLSTPVNIIWHKCISTN